MDVRINEKGKFFTPRIAKDAMLALVRTTDEQIVGYLYIRPDKRLKDEINEDTSRFLPITDAKVYAASNDDLIYQTSFMLVSYSHIISITPLEAVSDAKPMPWLPEHREEAEEEAE